jgi:hypothetical protein
MDRVCADCGVRLPAGEARGWGRAERVLRPRTINERRLLDPPGKPLSPDIAVIQRRDWLCEDCHAYADARRRSSVAFHKSFGLVMLALAMGFFVFLSVPATRSLFVDFTQPPGRQDWRVTQP